MTVLRPHGAASAHEGVSGAALFHDARFLALTGRMYPLERCIIAPRDAEEILTLCVQLISITIDEDDGNLLVFLPGMDEIQCLDKLVREQLRVQGATVNIVRLHSDLLGEGESSQENAEPSSAGRAGSCTSAVSSPLEE